MIGETKKVIVFSQSQARATAILNLTKGWGVEKSVVEENGIEGIKILQHEAFDIVICDTELKYIKGTLFAQEVKSSSKIPNMPFLLFGQKEPDSQFNLDEHGIVKFLSWPVIKRDFDFVLSSTIQLFKTSGTIEDKYTKAKDSLINKDGPKTIDLYDELRVLTKRTARSSVGLAQAYDANDEPEKAEKVMIEIAEEGKGSPANQLLTVGILLKNQQTEEAKKIGYDLLNREPGPFYFTSLAKCFFENKVLDIAKDICCKGQEKGYELRDLYILEAKCLHLNKNYKKSLSATVKAEKKFGAGSETLNLKGANQRRIGYFEAALKSYEAALKISPKDVKIYFNLAMCHVELKEEQQALTYLQTAVEMDPSFKRAINKIAEIKRRVA